MFLYVCSLNSKVCMMDIIDLTGGEDSGSEPFSSVRDVTGAATAQERKYVAHDHITKEGFGSLVKEQTGQVSVSFMF